QSPPALGSFPSVRARLPPDAQTHRQPQSLPPHSHFHLTARQPLPDYTQLHLLALQPSSTSTPDYHANHHDSNSPPCNQAGDRDDKASRLTQSCRSPRHCTSSTHYYRR